MLCLPSLVLYIYLTSDIRAFSYSNKGVLVLYNYPLHLGLLVVLCFQLFDPFFFSFEILLRKKDNILFISLNKVFNLKCVNDISSCISLNYNSIFINVVYSN